MENTYRDERRDRKRRELQRKRMKRRLMIVCTFGIVVGCAVGVAVGSIGKKALKNEVATMKEKYETQSKELADMQGEIQGLEDQVADSNINEAKALPWNLVLVNPWNEMEEGYEPELVEVEPDQSVDVRIADDLKKMLEDAKAQGLSPFICSAYRSVTRQKSLFDNGMQKRLDAGNGYYDAFVKTSEVIAVPGTSEHALGLAVDIVSNSYTDLDEGQEDTAEFQWLAANCHKYGFILRYPNGTTDITGIIYEPWHFRYVGVEVASEIVNLGVTLEEYLTEYYEQ